MALFFRQALTVALKDLRSEVRTKEALNASISFSVVILLLFSFAFEPSSEETHQIAGGLLWMVFAFAGALILNRSFARELVNDCLDALVSSPTPGPALFAGKAAANLVLLLVVELISFPVFGIFYNIRWLFQLPLLLVVMFLGTWGIVVIGTMFSAMTVNLRLRELMLPVLVYPIMIPCLMGAIQCTTALLNGQGFGGDAAPWLRLLIGFDIIFTILAVTLADTVLVG
jgi:heme exporter protein B